MPFAARAVLGATALTVTAGCAGGQFRLDESLRATSAILVEGALGMNAYNCDPHKQAPTTGLAADQAASVTIGSLSGMASAPHRELTSTRLFSEALLRDYEELLGRYNELTAAAHAHEVLAALGSEQEAPEALARVDHLLEAIHFVLLLPRSTAETMGFGFVAKREGRIIVAGCSSTDPVRTFGYLDGPHFSMACRIVSTADGSPRDLRVAGRGTWANYRFSGALTGPGGESDELASQNVSVLGMGGVRGFDLRRSGRQSAAIDFFDLSSGKQDGQAAAAAWYLPSDPSAVGVTDARVTTLALAHLFPWPSSCDDQHLRNEGWKTADPSSR